MRDTQPHLSKCNFIVKKIYVYNGKQPGLKFKETNSSISEKVLINCCRIIKNMKKKSQEFYTVKFTEIHLIDNQKMVFKKFMQACLSKCFFL